MVEEVHEPHKVSNELLSFSSGSLFSLTELGRLEREEEIATPPVLLGLLRSRRERERVCVWRERERERENSIESTAG